MAPIVALLALPSSRGGGPISTGTTILIFSFYGSLIPLWIFRQRILRGWRLRQTAGWPETEAFVERADWNYGGKENSVPIAEVAYSYTVQGERYSGYWRRKLGGPDQASDFVDEARGRKLLLRYRRSKPDKSFVVKVI